MNRRTWLAVGAVGAAATAAGVLGRWWGESGGAGDAVPPDLLTRSFPTPTGGTLQLAAFGGRHLLLNVWATWCPPCVRELPRLDAFGRAHAAAGWQVVGLAADAPDPVREFLVRHPVDFPVAVAGAAGITLARQLGNDTGGLPFSLWIDRQGRIRERHLGEIDDAHLDAWQQAAAQRE